MNKGGNVFNLVGLQVSDKMPMNILWKLRVFGRHILRLVLAKMSLPRIVCLTNHLNRFCFRYGYKAHIFRNVLSDCC
jgi:hypothetical protein